MTRKGEKIDYSYRSQALSGKDGFANVISSRFPSRGGSRRVSPAKRDGSNFL